MEVFSEGWRIFSIPGKCYINIECFSWKIKIKEKLIQASSLTSWAITWKCDLGRVGYRQVKDLEELGNQQQFKRVQSKMRQWAESFELLRWPRAWASWENLPGKREVLTGLLCCESDSIHSIVGLPFVQEMELKFENQILQHWQNEGVGWNKQEPW